VYVRHVAARSVRNARQGNLPVTILFFSCLIVLLRALSGAGFNPGEFMSSQSGHGPLLENLPLKGWRAVSQGRLEKEWARLSGSGMVIWEDVVRKERAWQQNWITPAMEALHNQRMRYLPGIDGDGNQGVIGADNVQLEAPMDEDEDLFAPEHEYIEKPLPVLNKNIASTSAS